MINNKNFSNENLILNQLHYAQQEINNLRLLNVYLQSTLIRVQTQLIEYIPSNNFDEIKRNELKEKLIFLRQIDDHRREKIPSQQISFLKNFKLFFDQNKQEELKKSIPLSKNEKQIEILFELFHELNTIIYTEHNDRISQLYITLAQTSHSVIQTREILDQTIHAHRIIIKKRFQRKFFYLFLILTFLFLSLFFIIKIINSIKFY